MMDRFKKRAAAYSINPFQCQRDGLTIRGTEFRPDGSNMPAAIVCHGFMAWQSTVQQYTRFLDGLGYCSYCFDFCGGSALRRGKSDGKTTDMFVLTEVRDLEAVISHVRSLPYTGGSLLLMGCSQGGLVSALSAAKHPKMADKLVLFYPALCIPDDARAGKMMRARFDPENIPEVFRCGPMKLGRCYAADVMDMDPFEEIRAYSGPVLIVHGTEDRIVRCDYARRAQRCYPNAQLRMIEGGGHGFSGKYDAIAMEYLKDFLSMA